MRRREVDPDNYQRMGYERIEEKPEYRGERTVVWSPFPHTKGKWAPRN